MTDLEFVQVNPAGEVKASVIWLHGLGDSGHGFAPIVPELKLPAHAGIRFVFPHAPVRAITINNGYQMHAWYDIRSLELDKRADPTGVAESANLVERLIEREIELGVAPDKIILAGFSQGGVIALHLGTRITHKLAGILALSTYMSEPDKLASEASEQNRQTPILMCHGRMDDIVPTTYGRQAYNALQQAGFNVQWQDYMMEHNVCADEIEQISAWLQARLTG